MAAKTKKNNAKKGGRDASTGRFISTGDGKRGKKTAVVDTVIISPTKPVHTTSGVSGSAIIKRLKINRSDIKAAQKLVKNKTRKTKTTSKKK